MFKGIIKKSLAEMLKEANKEAPKTLVDHEWERGRIEDLYQKLRALEEYLGIYLFKRDGYQVKKESGCTAKELPKDTLNN